jgi:hypothetical protein
VERLHGSATTIITYNLICEPADDERILFWNIACGENPVVSACDDSANAAPCKGTFVARILLTVVVTFSANVVHLQAVPTNASEHTRSLEHPVSANILGDEFLDVERAVSQAVTRVQIGFIPDLNGLQRDL